MKILLIVIFSLVLFRIYFVYLEQRALYYPAKEIIDTPSRLGVSYEEVSFRTSDGETLNGWYVPGKNAKVTILYCRGNAGNISHRVHRIAFFHEMGVNFFIFDYRGYGKSSGKPSEKGLYEDAAAAHNYLVSRKDIGKTKIVVYGKSLGGAVAAEVCLRRNVSALILESSLASVILQAQQLYPFLPMNFLITQKYDTIAKVKNVNIPKLISHGKSDKVISFKHGEALFEAAADPKQFLPFEGGHNDDIYVTSSAYKKELQKFLFSE